MRIERYSRRRRSSASPPTPTSRASASTYIPSLLLLRSSCGGQWDGDRNVGGIRGAGGGERGVWTGGRHDPPEENGWTRVAPCRPTCHWQDHTRSRHLSGAGQHGPCL